MLWSIDWAIDEAEGSLWNLADVAEIDGDLELVRAATSFRLLLARRRVLGPSAAAPPAPLDERRNLELRPFLSAADRRLDVAAPEVATS